jgi:hypothetical protein
VELLIVILVEILKIFTLFNKICGYEEPYLFTHMGMGMRMISYLCAGMGPGMGASLSYWVRV